MRRSILLILPLLFSQLLFAALDNASHLKGISYLYMDVDATMAGEISASEELDLSDIMELQLRRGDINLRPYVINQPNQNVPLVQFIIDSITYNDSGELALTLRIRDYVTIDRNGEKTVATIYEMRRLVSTSGTTVREMDLIKSELRDIMAEFVTIYRNQNL